MPQRHGADPFTAATKELTAAWDGLLAKWAQTDTVRGSLQQITDLLKLFSGAPGTAESRARAWNPAWGDMEEFSDPCAHPEPSPDMPPRPARFLVAGSARAAVASPAGSGSRH